eukprot:gene5166-7190_t
MSENAQLLRDTSIEDEDEYPSICGTSEDSYIWFSSDPMGISFALLVWCVIIFVLAVWIHYFNEGYVSHTNGALVIILTSMSIVTHLKVMLSDPGAVPHNAHPASTDRRLTISMCGRCDTFKPPNAHHDRISNRCISRMDHFCPWTNNSIGAKNQKHFFLFLIYTDIAASYMYIVLAIHLTSCSRIGCQEFEGTDLLLARILVFVLLFAILFTSSMIVNQIYGLALGLGTIDRMKIKADTVLSNVRPIPISHVFGKQWYFHWLPINPVFDNNEEVLQYRLGADRYSPTAFVFIVIELRESRVPPKAKFK